jgi:nicotinamide phosphoribosyltransferase
MQDIYDHWAFDTDSYKFSHFGQLQPGLTSLFSNVSARGGRFKEVLAFGLQPILAPLAEPVTKKHVDVLGEMADSHGEPFNWEGFRTIAKLGYAPLKIRAVPEGTWVPSRNLPLVTVEPTRPDMAWLVSYVETQLLRFWYPTTVATLSGHCRRIIQHYLTLTAEDPEGKALFGLHDFGSRGVSSKESAGLGGIAHLVNFRGTDTTQALIYGRRHYDCQMAGFSIPATEHSTITSWGRERELDAYRWVLNQYGEPGKMFACVSDSYDIYNAITNLWGDALKQELIDSGATLVIRPDSGNPVEVVVKCLNLIGEAFGCATNKKGYKVLPPYVRLIQGDGINIDSMEDILKAVMAAGWSTENVAFGMGGGLLQQVNRDTCSFAQKATSVTVDGVEIDVFKDPITDPGKKSLTGRLDLIRSPAGELVSAKLLPGQPQHPDSVMRDIFLNGQVLVQDSLDIIRARAWG